MSRVKTLQVLFKRYRRPGDVVFAWLFLLFSLVLLLQINDQTAYRAGGKLFAQPRFWPAVSLGGMTLFAALHLLSSVMSERIAGRWRETALWLASVEYALWFVLYAVAVPYLGYLPATLIFALLLTVRAGYRQRGMIITALVSALCIVLLFKTFLQVKLPGGQLYEVLPGALRQFMLTYF